MTSCIERVLIRSFWLVGSRATNRLGPVRLVVRCAKESREKITDEASRFTSKWRASLEHIALQNILVQGKKEELVIPDML